MRYTNVGYYLLTVHVKRHQRQWCSRAGVYPNAANPKVCWGNTSNTGWPKNEDIALQTVTLSLLQDFQKISLLES